VNRTDKLRSSPCSELVTFRLLEDRDQSQKKKTKPDEEPKTD